MHTNFDRGDWDWCEDEDDGRFPYTPDEPQAGAEEGECALCGETRPLPYEDGEVCAECCEGGVDFDLDGRHERYAMGLVDF